MPKITKRRLCRKKLWPLSSGYRCIFFSSTVSSNAPALLTPGPLPAPNPHRGTYRQPHTSKAWYITSYNRSAHCPVIRQWYDWHVPRQRERLHRLWLIIIAGVTHRLMTDWIASASAATTLSLSICLAADRNNHSQPFELKDFSAR